MIRFKTCARCRGDMYVEEDIDVLDVVCLQCGNRQSLGLASPYRHLVEPTSDEPQVAEQAR